VPSTSSPTLVCFDLGGVLVRICHGWAEACAVAGLDLREPEHLTSEATLRLRRTLGDRYQCGQVSCQAYYQGTHEIFKGLYSLEEIERVHNAWTLGEYPGVRELVAELNRMPDMDTACLSNTNHAHWERLTNADAYPTIQSLGFHLASHVLGCAKPGPEIFKRAESVFGRPASELLFFDDLAENVAGAERAGWGAVLIDPKGDTASQIRRALTDAGLELA
jgi:putative hydrolase of the HAD superfamily